MKNQSTLLKLILVISILICGNEKLFSQDYLERTYATNAELNGLKVIPSEANGYYILYTSQIYSRANVQHKIIMKVDSAGAILWQNDFDYQELAVSWTPCDMTFSPDTFLYAIGHFIGCFSTSTIFKFDRFGNIVYSRDTLGYTYQYSKLNSLCSMSDNDQLAGGYTATNQNCTPVGPYLLRMNPDGSPEWEVRWDSIYPGLTIKGISTYTDSTYIINLSDSSNILINDSGQIIPSNFPDGRFKIMTNGDYVTFGQHKLSRLSNSLATIWQTPEFTDISFNDLVINNSTDIFITGRKDTCNGEMLIQKYDTSGNLIFTRYYGGDLNDNGARIIVADSNHVVAIGNHFYHHWLINDATSSGCRIAITHSAALTLVRLPMNVLSAEQIFSSTNGYTLCQNDSIILTAPSGFSYSWNTGSSDQQITIDTTGSYEVTISDGSGNSEVLPTFNTYEYVAPVTDHFADINFAKCTGNFEDICLSVAHSDSIYDRSYSWNYSYYQSGNPIIEAPFGGFPAGSYFCIVSNVCGSDTSGTYNFANLPPTVSLGNDTILCNQDSLLLVPVVNNSSYNRLEWQDGTFSSSYWAMDTTGYDTLNYWVTYTDAAGCSATDSMQVVFDDCTGISQVEMNPGLQVFPNPVGENGNVNVKLKNVSGNAKVLIRVLSVEGKIVYERNGNSNETMIDLSKFDSGVYLIVAIIDGKIVLRKMVVKSF